MSEATRERWRAVLLGPGGEIGPSGYYDTREEAEAQVFRCVASGLATYDRFLIERVAGPGGA